MKKPSAPEIKRSPLAMVRVRATRTIENALRHWGFYRIAGCDEVGRGCLAGPVVAGAVVLDPDSHIPGLADSKMLTAIERERLNDLITARAFAWSVAFVAPTEIDTLNIHRASLEAMRRAVLALAPLPDAVLVDAFASPISTSPSAGSAWRSPVRSDCRRVHRRQGFTRPSDDRARERSTLQVRQAQRARPSNTGLPSNGSDTRPCIAVPSSLSRACLIGSIECQSTATED